MDRINLRDLVGGTLVAAVGAYFLWGALQMRIGTAAQMGPGFFPVLISSLVVLLGIATMGLALIRSGSIQIVQWRPMAAVLAAIGAFAMCLSWFGLIPAMIAGVVVSSLGDRTSRLLPVLALAVIAAIGAWLIFSVGLGLQLPGLRIPVWQA